MPNAKRGAKKPSPKRLERMAKVLQYREAGVTYELIADRLGISTTQVGRDLDDALQATLQEPADRLRATEARRLDHLTRALYTRALQGDDHAIDRMLKIMDRRAKLLGLDTPIALNVKDDGTQAVTGILQQLLNESPPE